MAWAATASARGRGMRQSGQKTEVQYLRPSERSGHDISLSVHIDAGVAIEKIDSHESQDLDRQQNSPRWPT